MKIKKAKGVQHSVEGYVSANQMSVYSCPGCGCGCSCSVRPGESVAGSSSATSNSRFSSTA